MRDKIIKMVEELEEFQGTETDVKKIETFEEE